MKKGIVIRAFSGNPDFLGGGSFLNDVDDFARCFERARAATFDGVQLYLEPTGYFSLESPAAVLAGVAEAARGAGVTISSLEIAPFSFSWTSDDEEERARGVAHVTRCLKIAAAMGVAGVLAIPGWVGLPWDRAAPVVRYDRAYERTREALATLAPVAERLGVSIMIENIWNRFLLSPMELRGLLEEVGSPRVRALLDVGNVVLVGYPEHWIEILGEYLQEIHLKDYRAAVGTVDGFVELLAGDVNWPAVIGALRGIGYDGFLTAEVFPNPYAPDLIVPQTAQAIDAMLTM